MRGVIGGDTIANEMRSRVVRTGSRLHDTVHDLAIAVDAMNLAVCAIQGVPPPGPLPGSTPQRSQLYFQLQMISDERIHSNVRPLCHKHVRSFPLPRPGPAGGIHGRADPHGGRRARHHRDGDEARRPGRLAPNRQPPAHSTLAPLNGASSFVLPKNAPLVLIEVKGPERSISYGDFGCRAPFTAGTHTHTACGADIPNRSAAT